MSLKTSINYPRKTEDRFLEMYLLHLLQDMDTPLKAVRDKLGPRQNLTRPYEQLADCLFTCGKAVSTN
jgi:hypothetical protein